MKWGCTVTCTFLIAMTALGREAVRRKARCCVVFLLVALAFVGTTSCLAAAPVYDSTPWLDDLGQMREAFSAKYANFEWAVFEREADLPGLFSDTEKRIKSAGSDADARAAFDRLVRRLGDGHVELHWPKGSGGEHIGAVPDPCGHYDMARRAKPLVSLAQGYVPLDTPQSSIFPIGTITIGKHRVGVLKIAAFDPYATPAYCRSALAALSIPLDKPCDDSCEDRIGDWAEARMNEGFIAQVEALKRSKIDTLLVDIADNGGGTNWAEAVARMLTPIRLRSGRMDFVRGEHWVKKLSDLETSLRAAAKDASSQDRQTLLKYAEEAEAKKAIAAMPCDAAPLWEGKHTPCPRLGTGFSATGVLASANPATLRGKSWASTVFAPMQYQYTEGLWRGPLIVLVDSGSASSSEEFAAELQDNGAALIMGEPTYGAGCGHTDGGTPTTLANSHATLELPDCVRLRADGSNEVRGVLPDVLVGFRKGDGPHLRAAAFLAKLPEALARLSPPGATARKLRPVSK